MLAGYSKLASRLSGFMLATALTGAVGFAAIPALICAAGAETWSVVAFGQAVGVLGTVLIGWGWGVSGAAEAALATPEDADRMLLRSVAIRAMLVLPVLVLGGGAAYLLAPRDHLLALLSAVAYSLNGMTAVWFYTGIRAPKLLIQREVLPRTLAIVAGLIVCAAFRTAIPFPLFMTAGVLVGVGLNVRGAGGSLRSLLRHHGRHPLPELTRQAPALLSTFAATAYTASPVVLVGVLDPKGLVVYALADRLYRTANMVGLPVLNVLQGAIPSNDPAVFRRRIGKGVRLLGVFGLVSAIVFALGAPLVVPLLTGGRHTLPLVISIPYGVTLASSFLSQVLGLSILVALGKVRSVALSLTLGAVCGLPVLIAGTLLLGAPGAAIGVAVSEGAVTLYQLYSLRRALREQRTADEPRQAPAADAVECAA